MKSAAEYLGIWRQRRCPELARHARELLCVVKQGDWKSIVDFGCGFGLHCAALAEPGRIVLGVDRGFDPKAIEAAKAGGYLLLAGGWEQIPPHSFDAGYSYHCLEHARDPIGWLHEWGRIVRPGGKLYIGVPHWRGEVATGHISPGWNAGQLLYALALAGWDCRRASIRTVGMDVWAIADRPQKMIVLDADLQWDAVRRRLPAGLAWRDASHMDGEIEALNWPE